MTVNPYETDPALSEYLLFHYGREEEVLPYRFGPGASLRFPQRCAEMLSKYTSNIPQQRALDLGCAVGGASFELAKTFSEVLGIDFSARFIEAANILKDHGAMTYAFGVEGDLTRSLEAAVDAEIQRSRVAFLQGDAGDLDPAIGTFDAVLLANLICRLPEPRKCLERLPTLLNPGGVVMLTCPFSWMEAYTPRANWLGGFYDEMGKAVRSQDTLFRILQTHFDFTARHDLPFLIREHARKYQWSVADVTVWKRKG